MIFSNSLRQCSYSWTAILAVVTSATFSAVSFGDGTDPADVWKERVDRFAKPFVEKKDGVAGLVVGIVTPDGRRAFYGYGKTKANGPQPTKDTLFEIGSVTKIFTTLILADMAEKKEVKLDDPVRLYLPADMAVPRRGMHEITLLELATHTSGLPSITPDMTVSMIVRAVAARVNKTPEDYFPDPFVHIGSEQLKRGLAEIKLDPQAKPKWSYSNLGIGLLGYCLARKEGTSYDQLVRTRITGPLGLHSTMQNPSDDDLKRMATGHRGKYLPVSRLSFDALAGCGALCSSADDLLRFLDVESGWTRTKLSEAMTMTRKERASETAAAKFGMCWFILLCPALL